jgi:hypothetical protein
MQQRQDEGRPERLKAPNSDLIFIVDIASFLFSLTFLSMLAEIVITNEHYSHKITLRDYVWQLGW